MRNHNILSAHEIAVPHQGGGGQKPRSTRRTLLTLIAAGALVCVAAWGATPRSSVARADSAAPQLEGAWQARVGINGGHPPFTALFTFNRGGTLQVIDETQLETPSATTGLGVWTKIGSNQYAFTWQAFLFDTASEGFPGVGSLRIHGVITLTGNDTYTSVSRFTAYDTEGNVLGSGCTAGDATRMTVEPLTDCPGAGGSVQPNRTTPSLLKRWMN